MSAIHDMKERVSVGDTMSRNLFEAKAKIFRVIKHHPWCSAEKYRNEILLPGSTPPVSYSRSNEHMVWSSRSLQCPHQPQLSWTSSFKTREQKEQDVYSDALYCTPPILDPYSSTKPTKCAPALKSEKEQSFLEVCMLSHCSGTAEAAREMTSYWMTMLSILTAAHHHVHQRVLPENSIELRTN